MGIEVLGDEGEITNSTGTLGSPLGLCVSSCINDFSCCFDQTPDETQPAYPGTWLRMERTYDGHIPVSPQIFLLVGRDMQAREGQGWNEDLNNVPLFQRLVILIYGNGS